MKHILEDLTTFPELNHDEIMLTVYDDELDIVTRKKYRINYSN